MKVAVFGCSWSGGMPTCVDENQYYYNWPYFLALNTGWHVENYAQGGTCIRWSLNNLHNFLNDYIDYFIIFQITEFGRFTYNSSKFNYRNLRKTIFPNYIQYVGHRPGDTLFPFQPNTAYRKIPQVDKNVQKMYNLNLKYYPEEYTKIDYESHVNYISNLSNLCFTHKKNKIASTKIMSIENEFGDKFNNFIFDDGHHFSKEGLEYQARFIEKLIKESSNASKH